MTIDSDRPADSPILEECWDEFTKEYAAVWDQLVYLRTSLYLLRRIAEFPFQKFASIEDQWFFTIVARSLYEGVVLGITKLVTDQKGDLLTLHQWRNRVLTMLRPDRKRQFQNELAATKFSKAVELLAKRARDFRDDKVAHLSLEDVRNGNVTSLGLAELDRLVDETERLFRPLLFGESASLLPTVYDPGVRGANPPWQTDVEKILTSFASGSHALNEPELNPVAWPHRRSKMAPAEVAAFNEWRARIGKQPV